MRQAARVSFNLSAYQRLSDRKRISDSLSPYPIRGLQRGWRDDRHKITRPIQDDNCDPEIRTKTHGFNGDKARPSRHDDCERLDATRLIDQHALIVRHVKRAAPHLEAGAIRHRGEHAARLDRSDVAPRHSNLLRPPARQSSDRLRSSSQVERA